MKTKVTIFNFISKIKELEDQLEQTKRELSTMKKVNTISNALTGLELVKKERKARKKIINEMYPKHLWGKEIRYVVTPEVATEFIEVLNGPFDEETVIEVVNNRMHREKDAVYFRYDDYSILDKPSKIIVQIL